MSEEQINETSEPEAISPPSIDLDSTIKVDGEEISVKDLLSSREETIKLKEYNEHARTLISQTGSNTESRETAVRYLMSQEGYSPNDIEEYINWTNETANQDQTPAEEPQYAAPQEQAPENEEFNAEQILQQQQEYQLRQESIMREQEQQRMNQIEDRQQRLGAEMMKKELNTALDSAMASDENIKKLMSIESGGDNRKDVLRHEVENAMMQSLRERRSAGENFNPAWFSEEAGKASKTVYDKFRSVIGDPDKIQRSPETATDSDSLFNKPPVETPVYEKGDSMGDINVKTREWTLDHLLRGAQEGAAGGESKA